VEWCWNREWVADILFEDRERTRTEPLRRGEMIFDVYDSCASPCYKEFRSVVNKWLAQMPASDRAELIARFRYGGDREFGASLCELSLHAFIVGSGLRARPHPEVPGSAKRPDYAAIDQADVPLAYIEVTTVNPPAAQEAEKNRENPVFMMRAVTPSTEVAAMRPDHRLLSAVLQVGEGRGFLVKRRRYHDCIVITAAHCLPDLPPPHPCAFLEELTYRRLLGPLGTEPTVWAQLLFADPVADIAVLGTPDGQVLSEQADAYDALMTSVHPLAIAEAPMQRDRKAAGGEARVLSLAGRWRDGRVERRRGWLTFSPEEFFEPGMSGSPIINMSGKAIGVASVNFRSPALVHHLPTGLLRSIRGRALMLREPA
jgi:hypothetical protein